MGRKRKAAREFHLDHFQAVGSALLRRKRLVIRYHARGTNEATEREISPQRLVHYRDNWYLDAWCHLRDGLRAFSVDAIRHAEILEKRARDVADCTVLEPPALVERVADHLGVPVIGTAGVLVLAKRKCHLAQVRPHPEALIASGYFRGARVLADALFLSGEE